ncbi:uncharacterized protein PFLUO_LOCUS1910 [Penicillium psychrofluorescens]|uniref:uncharacterized protein n=1 Tax=Penicillium psychrofluorescens TaxID=3158075 RepID=UPI003CCDADC8
MSLPPDYLERVYAGVLGKLIGVYLGRPFELWSHQRILKELGEIHYYVHEKTGEPLVVTDDDVTGTFMFLRALEEHGAGADLTAEQVGKTWLNNIILYRSVFWWGGNGISTEQTTFLNLKKGIPAPTSGSMKTNGKVIAEQIGAQIFIDGWAMVSPGNPDQAVKLAEQAATVSHDGDAVHSAKMIAAMEAEAFLSADVDHLLDTGLKYVPQDSTVRKVVDDIRQWAKIDQDWYKTRERCEKHYGLNKYPGICHVIPNLAICILALVYGGSSFHDAMTIVCTAGEDTDCNGGTVGCLVALMHGLKGFEDGQDWRSPVADRALLSGTDGGYAINNAARLAYDVVNMGRRIQNLEPLPAPKNGDQYYFTLPGSVQGFRASESTLQPGMAKVAQAVDDQGRPGLSVKLDKLSKAESVDVLTDVFTPPEVLNMRTYELMASPLVYSGQTLKAIVRGVTNGRAVLTSIRIRVYNENDGLDTLDSPSTLIQDGEEKTLTWEIPPTDGQPVQKIGIVVHAAGGSVSGTVWLDRMSWSGAPRLTLKPPSKGIFESTPGQGTTALSIPKCDLWRRAWVRGVDKWNIEFPVPFRVSNNHGEGMIIHGTRDWTDYRVACKGLTVHLGTPAGLAARVQGLNRYYAMVFQPDNQVALIKAWDEKRIELAKAEFAWEMETGYDVTMNVCGDKIEGCIAGGPHLTAVDSKWTCGGIGLLLTDGAVSANQFDVDGL